MTNEEYARIIAKNLKRIAYDNGKTQAEIAKDLHINKQTLSSWMNGQRIPRPDKIDLLCHYFNCTRSDIMEYHADNFYFGGVLRRVSEFDERLLTAYNEAPESRKEAVRALLDIRRE